MFNIFALLFATRVNDTRKNNQGIAKKFVIKIIEVKRCCAFKKVVNIRA